MNYFLKENTITVCIKIACISFWISIIMLFFSLPSLELFVPKQETLNILTWPQIIDAEFLSSFEKKMNVQVNISYIESNEELLAKLRNNKENHNYDLIMPSDFMLKTFVTEELIKKIDHTQLLFWNDLHPHILHHPSDPYNEYTVPCFWTVFGIGVNTDHIDRALLSNSWKLLFDPPEKKMVGMMEYLLPFLSIASLYYFGPNEKIEKNIQELVQILVKQKRHVLAYTESRIEYMLASGACAICLCTSADVAKMVSRFQNIQFIIPKEGTFFSLDSFAITNSSKKDDLIYAFLNYLYQKNVMEEYVKKFEFPSPLHSTKITYPIPEASFASSSAIPFYSLKNTLPAQKMEHAWITLHSA